MNLLYLIEQSCIIIYDVYLIGAGAVVTKDIPSYSVVVGIPGRVIKKRFDDEIVELLERVKWWNWEEEKIIKNIGVLRSTPDVDVLKALL